jgi:dihydrodipicolinate synthase/N-acetylneuraminate lyase
MTGANSHNDRLAAMARVARQLELRGVFASAITPRRPGSQDPDFSAALDLLDFLAAGGVQGVAVLEATGEFLDYTFAERQRIVYLGSKRSRVPLIAGVSHSTLAGAVQLADEAISSGADGLIVMPPYFFTYSQREIEEFYLQFADAAGDAVPILLHNFPQFTSKLELDTVRKLMNTGRFAGMKDSSGDWQYFEQLLALKQEHPFAVLAGADRFALRALDAKADGLISSCACALPELLAGLSRAISSGDRAQADALQTSLVEFLEWSEEFPFPVAIKRAVELRGQKAGLPLVPLAAENRAALEEFATWFTGWLPQIRRSVAHA